MRKNQLQSQKSALSCGAVFGGPGGLCFSSDQLHILRAFETQQAFQVNCLMNSKHRLSGYAWAREGWSSLGALSPLGTGPLL